MGIYGEQETETDLKLRDVEQQCTKIKHHKHICYSHYKKHIIMLGHILTATYKN